MKSKNLATQIICEKGELTRSQLAPPLVHRASNLHCLALGHGDLDLGALFFCFAFALGPLK